MVVKIFKLVFPWLLVMSIFGLFYLSWPKRNAFAPLATKDLAQDSCAITSTGAQNPIDSSVYQELRVYKERYAHYKKLYLECSK